MLVARQDDDDDDDVRHQKVTSFFLTTIRPQYEFGDRTVKQEKFTNRLVSSLTS